MHTAFRKNIVWFWSYFSTNQGKIDIWCDTTCCTFSCKNEKGQSRSGIFPNCKKDVMYLWGCRGVSCLLNFSLFFLALCSKVSVSSTMLTCFFSEKEIPSIKTYECSEFWFMNFFTSDRTLRSHFLYVCMSVRPSVRPSHNQIIRLNEKVNLMENLPRIEPRTFGIEV